MLSAAPTRLRRCGRALSARESRSSAARWLPRRHPRACLSTTFVFFFFFFFFLFGWSSSTLRFLVLCRSSASSAKATLSGGVQVSWRCTEERLRGSGTSRSLREMMTASSIHRACSASTVRVPQATREGARRASKVGDLRWALSAWLRSRRA